MNLEVFNSVHYRKWKEERREKVREPALASRFDGKGPLAFHVEATTLSEAATQTVYLG